MRYPDAVAGVWGPDDGLADPGAVVQGFVSAASRLGARLLTGVEVTGIRVAAGRVEAVVTAAGTVATRLVIIAAGAWAGLVGRMAGVDVPIVPLKRQIRVTAAMPEIPPDFPFVYDFAGSLYFHREGPGLLLGWSDPGQAPGFDQTLDEDSELVHLEASAGRLPLLERTGIARRWGGLYEITPDHHPIIGPVASLDGFHLMAGFSGHGFMHGPAAGLLLAEEILDGRSRTLDLAPLRLERFGRGASFDESLVL
jgi:sarcosine oxidase subunit beta